LSPDLPVYLVLNRYGDEFAEYHRFVDESECKLAYLTLEEGLPALDRNGALATVVLADLDLGTVLPAAMHLAESVGPIAGVVGLSEYDLLTAARLREALATPGYSVELVNRFRDKILMKRRVESAGLRVPRYRALTPGDNVDTLLADIGLPMILKPRIGAASVGVIRIDDRAALAEVLSEVPLGDYECEEYVCGEVLHVDGIRREGAFHFVSASVYVNTCLDFTYGVPTGSALLDRGPRRDRIVAFAGRCLDALGLADGAFHLELFETIARELVFLEVGLRPGGPEIPELHRDLLSIDLFHEAFRATVGLPAAAMPTPPPVASGGFVSVPEPRPFPSRVVYRNSMLGVVPEVYSETLPPIGDIFRGDGGYMHVGGRFLIKAAGHDQAVQAIQEVMRRYTLVAQPADAPVCADAVSP
jgi:ATP-grasp domain